MKKYSFMNKNTKIFDFLVDEDIESIVKIEFSGNIKYAPYVLHNINDNTEMIKAFNKWLNERYQINSLWYQKNKNYEVIPITVNKMLYSYGFSLSDQYFIKPDDVSISWESKNFFQNEFKSSTFISLSSLERNYDYSNIDTLYSPDITTGGALFKYWSINKEGVRILHKGANTFKLTEPINEYLAGRVCEILGLDYVNYIISRSSDLKKIRLFSECATFIDENTELIPAIELISFKDIHFFEARADKYIRFLKEKGIEDADSKIKKMFILDAIMSNHDRHLRNFGVIRNVETLQFLDVAPIFDTGSSLLTYLPDTDINYDNELTEMGVNDLAHRKVLEYCKDIPIRKEEIDKLLKLPEEYKKLLIEYKGFINVREEEIDRLYSKLIKNIKEVEEVICIKK